jgi:hypothetical protein
MQHNGTQQNDTMHNDTRCNDIQQNDTRYIDTHQNNIQHNDTQHNNIPPYESHHNNKNCKPQHYILPSDIQAECSNYLHCALCYFAEYHYIECRSAITLLNNPDLDGSLEATLVDKLGKGLK